MTSMPSFFASLPLLPANLGHKNDQFNDLQTTIAQMTEHTMTINMVYQCTETCTLSAYLTQLHTPTCFVPFCMLPRIFSRTLTTTHLLSHQPGQPAHITIACECHDTSTNSWHSYILPCQVPMHTAPADHKQPSLANASPSQLGHPPNGIWLSLQSSSLGLDYFCLGCKIGCCSDLGLQSGSKNKSCLGVNNLVKLNLDIIFGQNDFHFLTE